MSQAKDLTGRRFGKWTVAGPVKTDRGTAWRCRCDCGVEKTVETCHLISGRSKSCGCKRIKDIIGKRFGRLQVIGLGKRRSANARTFWNCRCDCGNLKEVRRTHLINGLVKSCGCLSMSHLMTRNTDLSPDAIPFDLARLRMETSKVIKTLKQKGYERSRYKDRTGQRFGMLVAMEAMEKRSYGAVVWKCQCDCGKETLVAANHLVKGNTKSCGCLKLNDLAGRRFGKLIAKTPTDQRRHGEVVWKCLCDCGNDAFVASGNLIRGNTKSCGCLRGKRINKK